jgi:hypothetical protein
LSQALARLLYEITGASNFLVVRVLELIGEELTRFDVQVLVLLNEAVLRRRLLLHQLLCWRAIAVGAAVLSYQTEYTMLETVGVRCNVFALLRFLVWLLRLAL